jgi:hypothetical protein
MSVEKIFDGSDLTKDSGETATVQPLWNGWVKKLDHPRNVIKPVDKHDTPTLGTNKPDIPGYTATSTCAVEYDMVVPGELKGYTIGGKGFTDAAKGQLLGFLEKLLKVQKFRFSGGKASATGWLSDGKHIQFFRLIAEDFLFSKITFEESPHMLLAGEGGRAFLGMLRAPLSALGYILPDLNGQGFGKDVQILSVLGIGSTSTVYAVRDKANPDAKAIVVAKDFLPNQKDRLSVEVANLKRLATLKGQVTELVCEPPDEASVLFLHPVGVPFIHRSRDFTHFYKSVHKSEERLKLALLTSLHFADIVDTVMKMHMLGFVHRDLTLTNIFDKAYKNEDRKAFVNDVGYGVEAGAVVPFAGALRHAPLGILAALKAEEEKGQAQGLPLVYVKAHPSHDLHALVCCLFQLVQPAAFEAIRGVSSPKTILRFWQRQFRNPLWAAVKECAEMLDYDALKEFGRILLPPAGEDLDAPITAGVLVSAAAPEPFLSPATPKPKPLPDEASSLLSFVQRRKTEQPSPFTPLSKEELSKAPSTASNKMELDSSHGGRSAEDVRAELIEELAWEGTDDFADEVDD